TRFNSYILDNSNERKTFICRLLKPKESSGRKENLPSKKLCIIWKKPVINCEARIRLTYTPNHSHLMEESDMQKWKEVYKVYEDSDIEYLKTKEVANIKQKLVGLMNSHLVGVADLKSDILITIEFLIKNNYQVESFQKKESLGYLQGLCFANLWQIENLTRYTIAVGILVLTSLLIEKIYILLDQSNVESNSIALAFPGLFQEYDVLLCTVHIVRTWIKNIYYSLTLNKIIYAIYKKTQVGYEKIVHDTINTSQQNSPFLLQITSTKPLESYHSELKAKVSVQYGLIS
ncbi:4429_t:CDS:2, partial [Scutellospora calospora]